MRIRILAAVIFALSATTLSACGQTDSVLQAQAGSPDTPTPPSFSDSTKARVKEAGTTYEPLDGKTTPPGISLARAMQLASEKYGDIVRNQPPAEAQYGRATNGRLGTLRADHSIKPSISGRPMWLLLFHGVEIQVSSPYTRVNDPYLQHGDFLIYVDAATGAIPRAETID